MMNEIWKDIKNYENVYQISNFGNIRSLNREVNNCKKNVKLKGKIISLDKTNFGHLRVNLYKKGNKVRVYVHRLVAEHFIPNPNNLPFINHIDNNPNNNYINNLEWCTHSENIRHAYATGSANSKHLIGENAPLTKFTDDEIKEIILLKGKLLQREIAKKYNTTQGTISRIFNKKRWKHV